MVTLAHPLIRNSEERRKWLLERKNHVTATDVYTIFGLGYSNRTVADLVLDKRTPDVADEGIVADRLRAGLELEPLVAARYAEATGRTTRPERGLSIDPTDSLCAATLDHVHDDDGSPAELKAIFSAPDDEWGASGSDLLPDRFLLQATWQAGVRRAKRTNVGAWFVGYQFRHYAIEFIPDLYELLKAGAYEFWAVVKSGATIDPTWRPSSMPQVEKATLDYLTDRTFELPPESDSLMLEYADHGAIIKTSEARRDEIKKQLKEWAGTHEKSFTPGGGKFTQYPAGNYWNPAYYVKARIDSRITPPKRTSL